MALPGVASRQVTAWRLSVGTRPAQGGAPRPSDHWRVTRPSPQDSSRYEVHPELQALLEGYCGEKPTRVPCHFPCANPYDPGGVYTALAFFVRRWRLCWCDRFEVKPPDLCREQGLPWPPVGPMEREYFIGTYNRRVIEGQGETARIAGVVHGVCDYVNCPLAAGDRDALFEWLHQVPDSMVDKRCCRPQINVVVFLPWAKGHSPWAHFASSSWATGRHLGPSLEQIQSAAGGAPLYLLPMFLTVTNALLTTPDGLRRRLPVISFVPEPAWGKLPEYATERIRQMRETSEHVQALMQAQTAAAIEQRLLTAPDEQERYVQEFRPETSDALVHLREARAEADAHFSETLPLEGGE